MFVVLDLGCESHDLRANSDWLPDDASVACAGLPTITSAWAHRSDMSGWLAEHTLGKAMRPTATNLEDRNRRAIQFTQPPAGCEQRSFLSTMMRQDCRI